MFSIFSRTKPLYLPVHVLFLLGIWKEFLGKKIFFILQIKVRHKVLNRSERVKYMYTCILFDLTIMIKIQPVGCPIAISLSVRKILFVQSITSISIPCLSFLLKLQLQGVFWFEIRNEPIVWIEVKVLKPIRVKSLFLTYDNFFSCGQNWRKPHLRVLMSKMSAVTLNKCPSSCPLK